MLGAPLGEGIEDGDGMLDGLEGDGGGGIGEDCPPSDWD